MNTAKKIPNRTANNNTLSKLTYSFGSLDGVSTLPVTIRPWIYYFVTLIKLGYSRITAQEWAITKSAYQSTARTTNSSRSTYRALSILETHGFIKRRKLKIGKDCHGLIIDIVGDRFTFFLHQKSNSQTNDMCDTSAHLPSWQGEEPKNTNHSFSARSIINISLINDQEQEQRQEQNKNEIEESNKINEVKTNQKKWTYNPIVFTLLKITTGMPNQGKILFQASKEIAEVTKNPNAITQSSVDWGYWITRWGQCSLEVRESFAAREILPHLTGDKIQKPIKKCSETISNREKDESFVTIRQILALELAQKQQDTKQDINNKNCDMINNFFDLSNLKFDSNISELDKKTLIEQQKKLFCLKMSLNLVD